jgi:hypothetical protein
VCSRTSKTKTGALPAPERGRTGGFRGEHVEEAAEDRVHRQE